MHVNKCSIVHITEGDSERASEVFLEASPRQDPPVPSPTAHKEQPHFKVSSRSETCARGCNADAEAFYSLENEQQLEA
jgi:hypothetical protein